MGLDEAERDRARQFDSEDPKRAAALGFAREVYENRGHVSDEAFSSVREAGYGDDEILEIIANVVATIFTNYMNDSVQTEVEFPLIEARGGG